MKKLTLALACSSLITTPFVFAASNTEATGTSYITGNVQLHDRKDFNGTGVTSTIEAGHTFTTGTTLLVELDGLQLGDTTGDNEYSQPAFSTIGIEQSFDLTDNLWVAAGYHHVLHNGGVWQYRPLVKIGYNFDNGISISNRTRWQIAGDSDINIDEKEQTRFDNNIAYQFNDVPLAIKYNNVYYVNDSKDDSLRNTMEHEVRLTWTRDGVQPYIEYRNQEDADKNYGHNNNVLVLGASYAF